MANNVRFAPIPAIPVSVTFAPNRTLRVDFRSRVPLGAFVALS